MLAPRVQLCPTPLLTLPWPPPLYQPQVWGKTGSKLYGPDSGADFVDNAKRFALFCKAAVEASRVLPFGPGEDCVFVANGARGWGDALPPALPCHQLPWFLVLRRAATGGLCAQGRAST